MIVIGGGVGGCAAALAAAKMGRRVIMTEETDWIGGQLTSQAVPPDEHPWIERMGAPAWYRAFRDGVRAYSIRALSGDQPGTSTRGFQSGKRLGEPALP